MLAPASFLTFGKVNDSPPQTDIFFGEGSLSTPSPSFLSAPGPLRLIFFGRGGLPHPTPPRPLIFVSAGPPPSQTDFFGPPPLSPPELFLTLGKVKCHRHLCGGGGLRLTFFGRRGGEGFKSQTDQSPQSVWPNVSATAPRFEQTHGWVPPKLTEEFNVLSNSPAVHKGIAAILHSSSLLIILATTDSTRQSRGPPGSWRGLSPCAPCALPQPAPNQPPMVSTIAERPDTERLENVRNTQSKHRNRSI